MLQLRQGLVRLVMQFMMVGTQLVYKRFLFAGYKDGGMETRPKVHEHPTN